MNLTYFSPKTEKRRSGIEGRGLFAKEPILKAEIVVIKGGYVLTKSQRDEVALELGPAEIQLDENLFIGPATPEEREGGMMYLNHSCEPNLGLQGQIVFVALRDIVRDEELNFDYAMTDDEDYVLQCNCRTASCRVTITGRDWRNTETQQKYDGYFAWYIQRKVDAQKRFGPDSPE